MRQHRFPWKVGSWREALAETITSLDELLEEVGLTRKSAGLQAAKPGETHGFAVRVPRAWLKRIVRGDRDDPLLRQVLPLPEEARVREGFSRDPVGEGREQGCLLQKYKGRVLLLSSSACPIHCRYCFRRHFSYGGRLQLEEITALKADDTLRELIFSGGDPLMLADQFLNSAFEAAEELPQLRRIRIHTRMPVVLPERIDDSFMDVLKHRSLPLIMVFHTNHPREIDEKLRLVCGELKSEGVQLLNQTVLLKGVNDQLPTQVALSEALMDAGILPYYLHMLDRVEGAGHFEVEDARARALYAAMAAELPGYLLPRLVREVTGRSSKTLIC